MIQSTKRESKFLSLVLRHAPEKIGIQLDREGWVDVEELVAASRRSGVQLTREMVLEIVATNDKKRFSLSEDGTRIRAAQGHSTDSVEISYPAMDPPEVLYHGTASRFVDSIKAKGLIAGSRHFVHLSKDMQTAIAVGKRHGSPVVFKVAAQTMALAGHEFHCSENGVWLTKSVPSEFITELD